MHIIKIIVIIFIIIAVIWCLKKAFNNIYYMYLSNKLQKKVDEYNALMDNSEISEFLINEEAKELAKVISDLESKIKVMDLI